MSLCLEPVMSSVLWITWHETPSLLPLVLHIARNQKLEAGKAWEGDLVGILRPVVKICHSCHKSDCDIQINQKYISVYQALFLSAGTRLAM